MKTLLNNALIYDGTGTKPFFGYVLIEDDRISSVVAGEPSSVEADRVIDLDGRSLAPGFIDSHSHNDWFAIKKNPLPYFAPFIRQGITTFVTGNCGLSATGFEQDSERVELFGGGIFSFTDVTGRYGTVEEYFRAIDKNTPCNIALLAGHCSARAAASGSKPEPLSPEEEAEMLAILEKALQQGAAGISLGLAYDPGLYAQQPELKKVVDLCLKYDKPLTVHSRAQSKRSMAYPELLGRSHLLRALDDMAELAKGTNLKLQYSHLIYVGSKSWPDEAEFMSIFDRLRAEGVDIMFDIYNETMGVSVITVILPPWYQAMSPEERRKPKNKLRLQILIQATSQLLGFGFSDIQVAYAGPGNEQYEGKFIHEIAVDERISDLDAYLKVCELSNFKGRVNQGRYTTPEIISRQAKHDQVLFMTDAWVEDHGVQNPAIYDCFPKFLRDSLLGKGDTLTKTIRKMTGAAADRFNLEKRGYIRAGYYADLTVFDKELLQAATPDQEQSFGITQVFINGQEVLANDTLDEEALRTTGRAIRA